MTMLAILVVAIMLYTMRGRIAALEARVLELSEAVKDRTERESEIKARVTASVTNRGVESWATPPRPIAADEPMRVAETPGPTTTSIDEAPLVDLEATSSFQSSRRPVASPWTPTTAVNADVSPHIGFEQFFGRLLPIWLGGLALAVSGFFVVKWSIDAGILSPTVRVLLGAVFGAALIGVAEVCLRNEDRVRDGRIAQSLAGAGIAVLYASTMMAHDLYHLIGAPAAFMGMTVVTIAAAGLSIRYGAPTAAVGLLGALLTPALTSTGGENVPLLAGYVGFVVMGMTALAGRQGWPRLATSALVGGFLWSILMATMHVDRPIDALSFAALMAALGFVAPQAMRSSAPIRIAAFVAAAAQMGLLVARGGHQPLHWGILALVGIASAWLSRRPDGFREAPIVASAIALAALLTMPVQQPVHVMIVLIGIIVIGAAPSIMRLWERDCREAEAAHLVVLALAWAIVPMLRTATSATVEGILLGTSALVVAVLAELFSGRGPYVATRPTQVVAVLTGMGALAQVLPFDAFPAVSAVVVFALMMTRPTWSAGTLAGGVVATGAAVPGMAAWLLPVVSATIGNMPLYTASLPDAGMTMVHVLPMALLFAAAAWRRPHEAIEGPVVGILYAAAGLMAGIVVHVTYRHVVLPFSFPQEMIDRGYAVRTLWEIVLTGCAWTLASKSRTAALTLASASLAHFVWFSLIVFQPLWTEQALGGIPLFSLLLPAFASAAAATILIGRTMQSDGAGSFAPVTLMGLLLVLLISVIRQTFNGSVFAGADWSSAESLTLSLGAVVMAAAWLGVGMRTERIEWRVGSLILMLGAVAKVFVFDASGLEGLARILSFAGLGISLIGIGWLYSRFISTGGRDGMVIR
jgi:uncharacterized membrane protein